MIEEKHTRSTSGPDPRGGSLSLPGSLNISFTLNGNKVELTTRPNRRLLDLLRDDLGLTGTKEGCSIGECGACTVLIDHKAVNSCLVLAGQINGSDIMTVEGLASDRHLHSLQENFLKYGAVQCGFCTPGMLMSAYALLKENPHPGPEEIKEAIAGNLCRCTGYKQIIKAIQESALELENLRQPTESHTLEDC